MSEIGKFLKELRGNRSLREVEKISGVSHTYLSSLEKGADPRTGKERKPTTDTLEKLAKAYDHSYFDLLDRAGYLSDISEAERGRLLVNDETQTSLMKMLDEALEHITNEDNEFVLGILDKIRKVELKYKNHLEDGENLTPSLLKDLVFHAHWDQEWIWNLTIEIVGISKNYISNGKTINDLTTFLKLPGITYKNIKLTKKEREKISGMLEVLLQDRKEE